MAKTTDLGYTRAEADKVEVGQKAWRSLKTARTWDNWRKTGAALLVGRRWALEASGAEGPVGAAYNDSFSHWLRNEGFADMEDKTRRDLLTLMEHDDVAYAEWKALPLDKRQRLNHPSTVLRALRKKLPDGTIPYKGPRKKPTSKQAAKQKDQTIADLEERAKAQEDKIEALQQDMGRQIERNAPAAEARDWLLERWDGPRPELMLAFYQAMKSAERKTARALIGEKP